MFYNLWYYNKGGEGATSALLLIIACIVCISTYICRTSVKHSHLEGLQYLFYIIMIGWVEVWGGHRGCWGGWRPGIEHSRSQPSAAERSRAQPSAQPSGGYTPFLGVGYTPFILFFCWGGVHPFFNYNIIIYLLFFTSISAQNDLNEPGRARARARARAQAEPTIKYRH